MKTENGESRPRVCARLPREPHAADEADEARIRAEAVEPWIEVHVVHPRIAFFVGFLEPLAGLRLKEGTAPAPEYTPAGQPQGAVLWTLQAHRGGYCLLPRSRHLPVAVTEGSLTRKVNEIGVRLWTDRSFDENSEICRGNALDSIAHARIARLEPISGAAPSTRLRPARLRP